MKNQTRKNRKLSKSVKFNDYQCCDATFDGIREWYKSTYERLGWMILAKTKGMNEKTLNYKHNIERLRIAILQKRENTHDKDRIEDLAILLKDLEVLVEHVSKYL